MHVNELAEAIIGASIEVHRAIGPGLLESAYVQCLCYELRLRQGPFALEVSLPQAYVREQLGDARTSVWIARRAARLGLKPCARWRLLAERLSYGGPPADPQVVGDEH